MKFGLFYSHQLPRPWAPDAEKRLIDETLEQIELADRLGYDHVWCAEHHFLEEYSHLSAPDLFLAAVSQRTSRIRIGHGIATMPPSINPAVRVAERVATLDLLSGGRVEYGTGESTTTMELDGFGVDRATKREQWTEALEAVVRMFVEEPFAGHHGRYLTVPVRNVVPKPLQKPHPPLWMACGSREAILSAGARGIGALNFSFADPTETRKWVDAYYSAIASADCVPAGFAVNAQVAATMSMHCHRDEAEAIERAADGMQFFAYGLGHYINFGVHAPGHTQLWEDFQRDRRKYGMGRAAMGQLGGELGAPQRGAIGSPDQIRALLRQHEEAGLDQAIFIVQGGNMRHEHICESLELLATEVLPEFRERDEKAVAEKLERLQPAIEAALSRREPPRVADPDYQVPARSRS